MLCIRGVAAAPCCSSSRAGSRCVVVAAPPPLLRRRLVISSAVAPPFRNENASSSFPAADASSFVIRPPKTDSEFYAIAALRAEAYYADQPGGGGRFVESYKKQFREQEARSLRERVAPRRRKKEGGLFLKNKVGNGGGSGNGGGGGGGVFGGVLGALVGRAAEAETENDSSSSSSSSAELFLPPECECLAAVEVAEEEEEEGEEGEEEGERSSSGGVGGENAPPSPSTSSSSSSTSVVLGALDLRPPRSAGGGHPAGVPPSDESGCAVLNVAVHPSARRRGVARALLSSAAEVASSRWAATALYTTVAATNAGARALYADFGFVEVVAAAARGEGEGGEGEGSSLPATTLVGRELLLRAEL